MTAPDESKSEISGSVAVVTGGNQGIGAAAARRLAAAGSTVVILGRNTETLQQTADEISGEGGSVAWYPVDLREPESLDELATRIDRDVGQPRVLVNAAGNSLKKPAFDVERADWDLTIDTHLRGTFFSCQAFGRRMATSGYGKIVNLSSTWSATVAAERSVYATAKAGVSHMTAALAVEWAPLGIRVNAVAPAATTTTRVEEGHRTDPEAARYSLERIPLGRLATTGDVVEAIIYLASPASDFVTGHTLFVDGGWRFSK